MALLRGLLPTHASCRSGRVPGMQPALQLHFDIYIGVLLLQVPDRAMETYIQVVALAAAMVAYQQPRAGHVE